MNNYINSNNYENIFKLCQKYGKQEQDLWLQALTHFAGVYDPNKNVEVWIQKVLSQVDFLSPLIVLEILSQNPNLTLNVIKDYLKNKLTKDKLEIEKNQ